MSGAIGFVALAAMAAVAAVVSAATIALRLRFADRGVDQPGHRSLHERPTPHGGGLGIVAATLACGGWAGAAPVWLIPVLVLAAVSWADDWLDLPFWLRLGVHLASAAAVVFFHGPGSPLLVALQVIVIAWSINAYNFMDGADGLAGSMSAVGFAAYAIGFAQAGQAALAGLCIAVAAASASFLLFNWHPARIFMGDVGAIPSGFLAGGLGWYGYSIGAWPLWFAPLVFAPFLFDATVTLVRRACRGERVWHAHREHYYQRMVRGGFAHDAMCLRWLLVMLAGASLAVLMLLFVEASGWIGAAAWSAVLVVLGRRIDRQWDRHMETEPAK